MSQVRCTYDAWHRETDDLNTKLKIAEQQRDEVSLIISKLVPKLIILFLRLLIKQNHYNKK